MEQRLRHVALRDKTGWGGIEKTILQLPAGQQKWDAQEYKAHLTWEEIQFS